MPYAQKQLQFASLWDAICSAAGLPQRTPSVPSAKVGPRLTEAVLTPTMLARPGQESIGRGATLAQCCAICQGPTGLSRADSPNLAGQYASVIYKQMLDFRSGARSSAIMSPFAANRTDQEFADVAAYYANLPRLPAYHPERQLPKPRIVIYGAPLRGIAACGSCHGCLDNKVGSPWLEGQSEVYMREQLLASPQGNAATISASKCATSPSDVVKATD